MLKHIARGALVATVLWAHGAQASTWDLDAMHTEVGFGVKHMMMSNVRGSFKTVNGTLNYDDENPAKSNLLVEIMTSSIDTHNDKRDDHLRSPDFLDSLKYPKIVWQSQKMSKMGKGLKIEGQLTIRDVSRPVSLHVAEFSKPIKDPFGMMRMGATATGKISRKDFGLVWNKALETGGFVVGDEIALNLEVEFVKKAMAAPTAAAD